MAINAAAKTSLSATAQTATTISEEDAEKGIKEDSNYIAVGVIVGDTQAEVNINSGDEIKVGGKDTNDAKAFKATATTENTISNSVTASSENGTTTNTAVNVTSYNASATVNVNRAINAENGGINLDATNTFENSLEASNVIGKAGESSKNWAEVEGTDFLDSLTSQLAKSVISLFKKSGENVPNKAGVTVGVFNQENNAKINMGSKADLTAAKNIDINAKNEISSLSFNVESAVNNQTSAQKSPVMIGLGVLVSNITNNADIIQDGTLTATDGNISINAESGMNYNQFDAIVDGVKDAFKEIAKDAKSLGKNAYNIFTSYESQVSEELDNLEKTEDPEKYMEALGKLNEKIQDTKTAGFDAAIKAIDSGVKLKTDLEELPSKLTVFLHPSSYANYYAPSSFNAGSESNKDSKLEAAGSFSINSMLTEPPHD